MSRSSNIALRIVGIVLVLVIMAGIGFATYKAGYDHGVADSPEVAEAIEDAQDEGGVIPYSHGMRAFSPFGMRFHSGFFPFGLICGSIFFVLIVLCALRMVFRPYGWGPWGMHHAKHHGWGPPPWAREDDESPAEKESSKKK
jgi:hypothetical protein